MEKAENQTNLEVSGQYGLWFRIKMVKLLHRLTVIEAETKPIPEEWLEFFGLTRDQLDKDVVVS